MQDTSGQVSALRSVSGTPFPSPFRCTALKGDGFKAGRSTAFPRHAKPHLAAARDGPVGVRTAAAVAHPLSGGPRRTQPHRWQTSGVGFRRRRRTHFPPRPRADARVAPYCAHLWGTEVQDTLSLGERATSVYLLPIHFPRPHTAKSGSASEGCAAAWCPPRLRPLLPPHPRSVPPLGRHAGNTPQTSPYPTPPPNRPFPCWRLKVVTARVAAPWQQRCGRVTTVPRGGGEGRVPLHPDQNPTEAGVVGGWPVPPAGTAADLLSSAGGADSAPPADAPRGGAECVSRSAVDNPALSSGPLRCPPRKSCSASDQVETYVLCKYTRFGTECGHVAARLDCCPIPTVAERTRTHGGRRKRVPPPRRCCVGDCHNM